MPKIERASWRGPGAKRAPAAAAAAVGAGRMYEVWQ